MSDLLAVLFDRLTGDTLIPMTPADLERLTLTVCKAVGHQTMTYDKFQRLPAATREAWLRETLRQFPEAPAGEGVPQPAPTPPAEPTATAPPAPTEASQGSAVTKVDLAIALLSKHPEWSARRIAKEVGCSPANLSKDARWKAARKAIKEAGRQDLRHADRHRGSDMDEYADDRWEDE